jgi:hypothetical protein
VGWLKVVVLYSNPNTARKEKDKKDVKFLPSFVKP